jgi:hypothetical protein
MKFKKGDRVMISPNHKTFHLFNKEIRNHVYTFYSEFTENLCRCLDKGGYRYIFEKEILCFAPNPKMSTCPICRSHTCRYHNCT